MSDAPTGMLVTATKVAVPFKAELLDAIKAPRFANRAPHLVGILATKKEDARNYAEVCFSSSSLISPTLRPRI